jgi:hypothetical protein
VQDDIGRGSFMRKLCVVIAMLAMAVSAYAAPNVTNVTMNSHSAFAPAVRISR